MTPTATILQGDALEVLKTLPDESVHCCVTSPPYWGLRDYKVAGQIGLEKDFRAYIGKMVAVFRELKRVLRKDGTLWVNIGDCYATGAGKAKSPGGGKQGKEWAGLETSPNRMPIQGLKPKDLIGMPWRLAFALQADGWYLRSDIIWHKPNPMPESIGDRPTKAHEYLFLLTKSPRYFYDAEAIKEPVTGTANARGNGVNPKARWKMPDGWDTGDGAHGAFHRNGREKGAPASKTKQNESFSAAVTGLVDNRNKRTVWTVPTVGFADAHFATYPPDLIRPCVRAGCPIGGTVLDPFAGSGTTGQVALEEGRSAILIELNPDYIPMIRARTNVTPGLAFDQPEPQTVPENPPTQREFLQ